MMRRLAGVGLACAVMATGPVMGQITVDADRTITQADAGDLTLGFTVNNGAVLTIDAGTTVNVSGPVLINENARLVVAGTLAEPVRIAFGSGVSLDYRPASATGVGMDFEHAVVTTGGAFTSQHAELSGYLGGAFPGVRFRSSIVEVRGGALTLNEANYEAESTLFFGNGQLLSFLSANSRFTDCVFIRRSRPTATNTAGNSIISHNNSVGEQLFQNCRFSGSLAIYLFNDSAFRFVSCDFSDTVRSMFLGFFLTSATFEDSIVSPVNNNSRGGVNYLFTNSFPDLPAGELVLGQAASTVVTITSPLSAPPFRSGDVNNDGVVNGADVAALMEIVVGNASAGDLDFPDRADADGNGTVDERDVAVLRAFVDGVLPQLPEVVAP